MRNFKLTLSYDGTRYDGWQKQGNTERTIQEKLESALTAVLDQETEVAASGRTDAGVHAMCQICSFRAETNLPCDAILSELRERLPADIGAEKLEDAPQRFHARLNCREKTYKYFIRRSPEPDVFCRRFRYVYTDPLDMDAMRKAAGLIAGTHDFRSFCSNRHLKKSSVRTVRALDLEDTGTELVITVTGDGFLYNMVRIIVGTLIEVGSGKRSADSIPDIFAARDRACAGYTVPPQGLFLWDVEY